MMPRARKNTHFVSTYVEPPGAMPTTHRAPLSTVSTTERIAPATESTVLIMGTRPPVRLSRRPLGFPHAVRPRQLRFLHLQPRPVLRGAGRSARRVPQRRDHGRGRARAQAERRRHLARPVHPRWVWERRPA